MEVIKVNGVTVSYGSLRALADVWLQFGRIGITGLIGANGAGKTTLVHAILGLVPVSEGTVDRGDLRISYCPDTPSFEKFLTAAEVLRQSAAIGIRTRKMDSLELLKRVGLGDAADRRVGGFSRGMKQRLGIAAALVRNPELLILDEPTSALDPAGRDEVMSLVSSLRDEAAVVFSSHILSDVERVADQIIVLHLGRVIYDGPIELLLRDHGTVNHAVLRLRSHSNDVLSDLLASGIRPRQVHCDSNAYEIDNSCLGLALSVLSSHAEAVQQLVVGERSLQRAYEAVVRIAESAE